MDKIKLDIGFANIVAEKNEHDIFKEMVIYIEDKETGNVQDITLVRKAESGGFECLIWTDENDEDYTNKFTIKRHIYEYEEDELYAQ